MKRKTKSGHKKGQAVMEYLITYGLALFVILIVLAILVAVVLPSLQAPETCQFTQPGFSCSTKKHALVFDEADNNVKLLFQLDNQQGKGVKMTGVLCSSEPPANVEKREVIPLEEYGSTNQTLAAGQSITFGSAEATVKGNIVCKNEDATDVVLTPNSNFRGSLAITYKYEDDIPGAPERLAVATVTGIVQAE